MVSKRILLFNVSVKLNFAIHEMQRSYLSHRIKIIPKWVFLWLLLLYQRVTVKSNSVSTDSFAQPTDIFLRLPRAQVVREGFEGYVLQHHLVKCI